MILHLNASVKFNKAVSRLTVMLFLMIISAAVLGALAFVMKHSKDIAPGDLLSLERLKQLFYERKPLITRKQAEEIKSFALTSGSDGLIVEPGGVNEAGGRSKSPVSEKKSKNDEIIFRNNDVITGVITSDKLSLKTEHGVVNFNFKDIVAAYSVYETEKPYDKIISKNGDKIGGTIIDEFITIKTSSGDILKISTFKIKIINKNIE